MEDIKRPCELVVRPCGSEGVCERRWMTCFCVLACMCACVCVCPVDVTVISDQYSPLATDLRSFQPSSCSHLGRGETHSHTNYYTALHTCTNIHKYTSAPEYHKNTSTQDTTRQLNTHTSKFTHQHFLKNTPLSPTQTHTHTLIDLHNIHTNCVADTVHTHCT